MDAPFFVDWGGAHPVHISPPVAVEKLYVGLESVRWIKLDLSVASKTMG
eukprot:gene2053-2360_t